MRIAAGYSYSTDTILISTNNLNERYHLLSIPTRKEPPVLNVFVNLILGHRSTFFLFLRTKEVRVTTYNSLSKSSSCFCCSRIELNCNIWRCNRRRCVSFGRFVFIKLAIRWCSLVNYCTSCWNNSRKKIWTFFIFYETIFNCLRR